jgi:hypothetical protein
MCHGPVSQWPTIEPGASLWKYHGCQTASAGGWRLEAGRGVVQLAEQPADPPDGVVAPEVRVAHLAPNVGEHFVASPVVPIADHPWGAGEADGLQMPQQGVDGGRPRLDGTKDGVVVADHQVGSALGRRQGFAGRI